MNKFQTATTTTVRDINRPILLNLVRLAQPISRADLSRRTGMFRSNVSSVVDDLLQEGMLIEERPVASGRGRIPTHLRLNDEMCPVLGVYVQPEVTYIAYAGLTAQLQKQWSFPTPTTPARFVRKIVHQTHQIQTEIGRPVKAVALAIPGFVNTDTGYISWAPAMPAFSGYDLVTDLRSHLAIPVMADNDCNLGALAEQQLGEIEGDTSAENFVLISIGDYGLGGAIVLDSKLYRGHNAAFAGEFGHMTIDGNGVPCTCGRRGCLERYVNNEATWSRDHRNHGQTFDQEQFRAFLQKAQSGDNKAIRALRESAEYLALGIANIVFSLNPRCIVFAGKVTEVWDIIRQPLEGMLKGSQITTEIRVARMQGESSLLQGAIYLALSPVFAHATPL